MLLQMRIWQRSFLSETIGRAGWILLGFVFLTGLVILGRQDTRMGQLAFDQLLVLFALGSIKSLPQQLTFSLFASLLISFGRMMSQREFASWAAAGLRLRDWLAMVVLLAAPLAVVVGWLALSAVPWSLRAVAEYRQLVAAKAHIEQSRPNVFGLLAANNYVYHLGTLEPHQNYAEDIFVAGETDIDRLRVLLASNGKTATSADGNKFLELTGGHLYAFDFNTGEVEQARFVSAQFDYNFATDVASHRLRALALDDLAGPQGRLEFYWRLGFGPAVLILSLLAVPAGLLCRRVSREYIILIAVLGYWLFYVLAGLGKDLGFAGWLEPWQAILFPLALAGLLLLALLLRLKRGWWM